MNKRGKVLRDPHFGPGLLMIEGRQYQFWLDNTWMSEVPPKPGLLVDVTLNARDQIQSIAAVSHDQLERELPLNQQKSTKKLRRILWNAVERCFH